MNEFDKVAYCAHDHEANPYGLRDLDEFALIGFRAPVEELGAISEEVARNVGDFFELVGHSGYGNEAPLDACVEGKGSLRVSWGFKVSVFVLVDASGLLGR